MCIVIRYTPDKANIRFYLESLMCSAESACQDDGIYFELFEILFIPVQFFYLKC